MNRIWILGAADPEMEMVERLLAEVGEQVAHAVDADGARIRPEAAYRAVSHSRGETAPDTAVYLVECDVPTGASQVVRIDHHRPGDPGYGRPPEEFLSASSIGQVVAELARLGLRDEITRAFIVSAHVHVADRIVLAAAADHCLAAAYRSECPGDPDALMRWRVESRAAFQRRPAEAILADVERAREVLRAAPEIELAPGVRARYMRRQHVPELPEASAREGLCFVADGLPGPDWHTKVVCQSGSPEQIRAFMEVWGPANGLKGIYGDPARGFAGGYLPL
jgi:hypothetical protein